MMTAIAIQAAAAAWLLLIASFITTHTRASALILQFVPGVLAILNGSMAFARFMGWAQ